MKMIWQKVVHKSVYHARQILCVFAEKVEVVFLCDENVFPVVTAIIDVIKATRFERRIVINHGEAGIKTFQVLKTWKVCHKKGHENII